MPEAFVTSATHGCGGLATMYLVQTLTVSQPPIAVWGRVVSLHAAAERGFPRTRVEGVNLVAGYGIAGDRKAGKRENRAVLLVGQATYDHLNHQGLLLPYGSLGENIVLDGDPHSLTPGTQLRIGEALLEVSLYCMPCQTLRDRYGKAFVEQLGKRRGMLARVLQGGLIYPENEVLTKHNGTG